MALGLISFVQTTCSYPLYPITAIFTFSFIIVLICFIILFADPITHIKTRITKTDLTKLNCFLVYEMEPLQTSDILFEENVLTVNEHDIIEGIKSLRQRNEQLLSLLHGKSQDQLDRFAYTLYEKDFIREYIRDILTQDEEQKPGNYMCILTCNVLLTKHEFNNNINFQLIFIWFYLFIVS